MAEKNDERIKALFHQAWGQAKASPEYNKKVWNEFQMRLFLEGIPV